jgi:hypothetical protein
MSGSCGGQGCSCGYFYYCIAADSVRLAPLVAAGVPHHRLPYIHGDFVVVAPGWCYRLRCGLDLYRVPEREWAGYFRAVHQGKMSIDDLAVLFALAEDA